MLCGQCHTLRGEGGKFGPELTEIFKKYKGVRRDVLQQIHEPFKVVEEKYRLHAVRLKRGTPVFGLVTERTPEFIRIVTDPFNPEPRRIALRDIEKEKASSGSLMPPGLLNLLSKQDILDMLAFLEVGGDPTHHLFRK